MFKFKPDYSELAKIFHHLFNTKLYKDNMNDSLYKEVSQLSFFGENFVNSFIFN